MLRMSTSGFSRTGRGRDRTLSDLSNAKQSDQCGDDEAWNCVSLPFTQIINLDLADSKCVLVP